MSKVVLLIAVLGYLAFGLFLSAIIDGENPSVLIILFWPIAIVVFLLFGIIGLIYKAGLFIHNLIF